MAGTKMAKHNKKRNVGLLHEQLVRYASEKIVEGNKSIAEEAIDIINEHFTEESELYKEFRLFNALVHTNVQSTEIARRIILESKSACKNHKDSELRSEKSQLIRSINHKLDESGFYNRKIPEYKVFATVQALLNEWRGAERLSPDEIVKYEKVLEDWLVRENSTSNLKKNQEADPLALKLMIKKFNKKYANLSRDQSNLLESSLLGDVDAVHDQVRLIQERAIETLDIFYAGCENDILNKKRMLIESRVKSLSPGHDDKTIKKALMISELILELESGENE